MPEYQGTAVRISHKVFNFRVEADTAAAARDKILQNAMNTDFAQGKEVHSDYEVEDLVELT